MVSRDKILLSGIKRIIELCEEQKKEEAAEGGPLECFQRIPEAASYDTIKTLLEDYPKLTEEEILAEIKAEEEFEDTEEIPIALDKIEDFLRMVRENSVDVEIIHKDVDDIYGDKHEVRIERTDKCLICRDEDAHSMYWAVDDFEGFFRDIKLNRHGSTVTAKMILIPKRK